ncbi:hypothetical protein ACPCUK_08680 [Streptomyces arboris]|uniref:hypothetical protein n=1 Tax=Streptomyces arboris TaxID=2600619 RepID=UPI003C2B730C
MQNPLEQTVILPFSIDVQITRCHTDRLELVLLQHALRRSVVKERSGLDAVQPDESRATRHTLAMPALASPRF